MILAENDAKDISLDKSNNISQEENNEIASTETIKNVRMKIGNSNNELERLATFLCLNTVKGKSKLKKLEREILKYFIFN